MIDVIEGKVAWSAGSGSTQLIRYWRVEAVAIGRSVGRSAASGRGEAMQSAFWLAEKEMKWHRLPSNGLLCFNVHVSVSAKRGTLYNYCCVIKYRPTIVCNGLTNPFFVSSRHAVCKATLVRAAR